MPPADVVVLDQNLIDNDDETITTGDAIASRLRAQVGL